RRQELIEFVDGEIPAVLGHDVGTDAFSDDGIGHGNDGRHVDARMAEYLFFDGGSADVVAGADDEVCRATDHPEIVVVVDLDDDTSVLARRGDASNISTCVVTAASTVTRWCSMASNVASTSNSRINTVLAPSIVGEK